jgi:hypothetical protein
MVASCILRGVDCWPGLWQAEEKGVGRGRRERGGE